MNYVDIFIVCLILLGFYRGFSKGLIIELSSFLAIVLGVYGSIKFSEITLNFINSAFSSQLESIDESYLKIFSFAFTFIIIIISISLLARFLTKIIKILLLGWINKVLGGLFGSLKYLVLISFVVVFFDNINSEFSVVETKEVEKVMLFKPFLEVGNNLLKIVNYDSIDFFD